VRDLSQIPEKTFELWPGGAPGAKGTTPEDRPRLTPYFMTGATPHPCVIVCPGGGYGGRAPHEGEPIARWCNKLGIAAVVLDYRVAPYRHPIPARRRATRHPHDSR
jgi:acetyl esterase/lipase